MSVHMSILGTCVVRDVFRVMDKKGKYKIDRYVQAVNPVAAVATSPLLEELPDWSEVYFDSKIEAFSRRNAYLDLKKNVFAYLAEEKSDWLLIDIGDIRIDLSLFDDKRQRIATSFSVKRGGKVIQERYLPPVLETISVLDLDKSFLREYIEIYLDKILELYPQEKIIIFESYAVNVYYDRDFGGLKYGWLKEAEGFNKAFELVFPYCLKKLPKAHVIAFPKYILGDEHHIWGSYPLHYLEGYYQYAFEAVEAIVENGNRNSSDEKELLRRICSKWERMFYVNYTMLNWLGRARIDIKNQGKGNDVKIKISEGMRSSFYKADWFSQGGVGYVMETYDRHLVFELECQGAGILIVRLMGIDRSLLGGSRLPLWVDYTKLTVNGEEVFREKQSVWHDKAYSITHQVIDGEKIKVEIDWTPHGYQGEELISLCRELYKAMI